MPISRAILSAFSCTSVMSPTCTQTKFQHLSMQKVTGVVKLMGSATCTRPTLVPDWRVTLCMLGLAGLYGEKTGAGACQEPWQCWMEPRTMQKTLEPLNTRAPELLILKRA